MLGTNIVLGPNTVGWGYQTGQADTLSNGFTFGFQGTSFDVILATIA
jgi:hypothetical protein